ncbi:Phosphatidate cytidylyltransferase [Cynara cardunculus var. scolymus]|uniref:phytol kinase n=1 Tax=Cynara cardunculus var. scolymus TaxID=59895 RepID=A0A103YIC4_CYNCS|nr:Phosphatidate cytidylyltransferase [Cynara cardunculus var. scolymus]
MASTPHSSISAVVATTAANLKLSLLRNQFCPRRHDFRPRLDRIWNTSVDVHNQRRLLLLLPPRNVRSTAFAVNVSGPLLQDAGATVLVVAGAYALVAVTGKASGQTPFPASVDAKIECLVRSLSCLDFVFSPAFAWYIDKEEDRVHSIAYEEVTETNATSVLNYNPNTPSRKNESAAAKSIKIGGRTKNIPRCPTSCPVSLTVIAINLSRKLVHILSGLLYMGCWPIFRELLRGPLYYVLVLILSSLVFWRESPVGVISLSMMCGGDGIADIMGRRFGFHKIPYNKHKSWAGSISMFIVGFLISIGMLYYFSIFGYFELDWVRTVERVAMVAMVATLVESLPTNGGLDDNISVPLVSMVTAYLSFGF